MTNRLEWTDPTRIQGRHEIVPSLTGTTPASDGRSLARATRKL